MPVNSTLTRADYEEYLVVLYFGQKLYLPACIDRAYRDFSRTMHGMAAFEDSRDIFNQASRLLEDDINGLKSGLSACFAVDDYDQWHRATSERLISSYAGHGFHLYVGQAQKWINMTMKYIFTLGEERLPGFGSVYPYCHVPFDNILLGQLGNYGFPMINCSWSRMDDYAVYLEKQKWIRDNFPIAPLDVEFQLWKNKGQAFIPPRLSM